MIGKRTSFDATNADWRGDGVKPSAWWLLMPSVLVAFWVVPLFLDSEQAGRLVEEDGFFENLSALLFFASGGLMLAAWGMSRKSAVSVWLLLLGLLMIFIGGEEISWGQRFFGWSTPAGYDNIQGETTIHNHRWFDKKTAGLLSMSHLFEYFCIVYGFIVPLAARRWSAIGDLVRRFGIPLVPATLGIAFPINFILSKLYQASFDFDWIIRIAELRECSQALVWFFVALVFYTSRRTILA